jgi:two-component sensor histidine kinase
MAIFKVRHAVAACLRKPSVMVRMKLSLRQRLFVLVAVALLPALAVLAVNEISLRRDREVEVRSLALQNAQQASASLQRAIDGLHNLLIAVSAAPVVWTRDPERCSAYLAAVQSQVASLNNIIATDRDGRLVCSSRPSERGMRLNDRSYFSAAMQSGDFVIGEYTESRTNGVKILPAAMPLRDPDGTPSGVIAAGIRLDWLQERIRERGLPKGAALTIADRNGVIVAREPLPEQFVGSRIPDQFQPLVQGAETGAMEVVSQDGTVRIIGYKPARLPPAGLYVSSGISKSEAFAPIDRASYASAALIACGAAAAAILAWVVGRSFVRQPVDRLLRVVEAWRGGSLEARTGMDPGDGEIEAVGAALDQMLDEIRLAQQERDKAEEQRQLLMSEMAHRIKNTLTVVQALARQPGTSRGGAGLPATFQDRIAALATAYDALLANRWTSADLRRSVEDTLRPYTAGEDDERFELHGPPVELPASAVLALVLTVHELCVNAIKYGALARPEGRIDIAWRTYESPEGERLQLNWRERGGPPVVAPERTGFGTRLMERAFGPELKARVETDFAPSGVIATLDFLVTAPRLAEGRAVLA